MSNDLSLSVRCKKERIGPIINHIDLHLPTVMPTVVGYSDPVLKRSADKKSSVLSCKFGNCQVKVKFCSNDTGIRMKIKDASGIRKHLREVFHERKAESVWLNWLTVLTGKELYELAFDTSDTVKDPIVKMEVITPEQVTVQ